MYMFFCKTSRGVPSAIQITVALLAGKLRKYIRQKKRAEQRDKMDVIASACRYRIQTVDFSSFIHRRTHMRYALSIDAISSFAHAIASSTVGRTLRLPF